jgi:hypothetical protein
MLNKQVNMLKRKTDSFQFENLLQCGESKS